MSILKPLSDVILAQHRADVLQQVADSLKDSTKTLSKDIIHALMQYAQQSSTDFSLDKTVVPRLAQHHYQMEKVNSRVAAQWDLLHGLQKQLSDLRTYHGYDSAEALKAVIEAGKRAISIPATVAKVHISASAASVLEEKEITT